MDRIAGAVAASPERGAKQTGGAAKPAPDFDADQRVNW